MTSPGLTRREFLARTAGTGMMLGLSAKAANELLDSIRQRVRTTLLEQSAL